MLFCLCTYDTHAAKNEKLTITTYTNDTSKYYIRYRDDMGGIGGGYRGTHMLTITSANRAMSKAVDTEDPEEGEDALTDAFLYCLDPSLDSPANGSHVIDDLVDGDDDSTRNKRLRKVLWYTRGYGGARVGYSLFNDLCPTWAHAQHGASKKQMYYALCHVVLSRIKDGNSSSGDWNDGLSSAKRSEAIAWQNAVLDYESEHKLIPSNFTMAYFKESGKQMTIFGYEAPLDKLKIKKVSTRSEITDGNPNYDDLSGAKFRVYTDKDCEDEADGAGVMTTNKKGETDEVELPEGTYWIKEIAAPEGFIIAEKPVKCTLSDSTTDDDNLRVFEFKDEPVLAEQSGELDLLLLKLSDLKRSSNSGDANLLGQEFTIRYYPTSNTSGKAEYTWVYQTVKKGSVGYGIDMNNSASFVSGKSDKQIRNSDGKVVIPLGYVTVTETGSANGYLVNPEVQTKKITVDSKQRMLWTLNGNNEPAKGSVEIAKIDNDLSDAYSQGDASLKGAEFTITNKSAEPVVVEGKEYAVGKVVKTIVTDESGRASSGKVLPYGTYEIKESKPSTGYKLNEEWKKTFSIRSDGEVKDFTTDPVREAVIRGGVKIIKRDKELKESEALGGADLNDIVFTIRNVSDHDVVVRKDTFDIDLPELKTTYDLLTDDDLIMASGTSRLLEGKPVKERIDWKKLEPKDEMFGDDIKRVAPGEDAGKIIAHWNDEENAYTAETYSDDLPYGTYTIRESRSNDSYQRTDKEEHEFTVSEEGVIVGDISIDDYVYRGDLQIKKTEESSERGLPYVPFRITSLDTGESHIIVSDENGLASTEYRVTKDELEEDEDADTDRTENPFDDLDGEENITTQMLKDRKADIRMGVWFKTGEFGSDGAEMDSSVGALPYGNYMIEELRCEANEGLSLYVDDKVTVREKTRTGLQKSEVEDRNVKIKTRAAIEDAGNITDIVSYEGLNAGSEYTMRGYLVDRVTGEEIEGYDSETVFTAEAGGNGEVSVVFDTDGLEGEKITVFEECISNEGEIIGEHKDVDDENQSVDIPGIGTTAGIADANTIVDTVSYHNLTPGTKYELTGYLIDRETGEPIEEAENTIEFRPEKPDGEIDISIPVMDGKGKTLVVFEELYDSASFIACHKDIDDEDQTVEMPELSTQASYVKDGRIVDRVSYTNLLPGETYMMTAWLSDNSGKEIDGTRMSPVTFTPDERDGVIEVPIGAEKVYGETVVAYEECTLGDTVVAEHKEPDNVYQTVEVPGIGTRAGVTSKNVVTDTVSYTNLIPGTEYTLISWLVNKEDGQEAKGSRTTTVFTPDESEGSIDVKMNAAALAGGTAVAFEELYAENVLIAKHKDIGDKKQTANIPDIGTVLTGKSGGKEIPAAEKTTVVDTVKYRGLTPGKKYVFKGTLIDKERKRPISGGTAKSNPIVVTKSEGMAEVTFTVNTSELLGREIVAFEEVYDGDSIVAEHKDINDRNQTVVVSTVPAPKTGDATGLPGLIAMFLLSTGMLFGFAVKRRQ